MGMGPYVVVGVARYSAMSKDSKRCSPGGVAGGQVWGPMIFVVMIFSIHPTVFYTTVAFNSRVMMRLYVA